MKKAVIEIGSNSVRYAFGEKINSVVEVIYEKRIITRLRDCVAKTGLIEEKKLLETLSCVNKFIKDAKQNNADDIQIIATDVLRKAQNKEQVIETLKTETGYEVKVLSPEEEAGLAFLGATQSTNQDKNFLVLDIGGGSTEIIHGNKDKILTSTSLPLGAIKTTEEFFKTFPPSEENVRDLEQHIKMHLGKVEIAAEQNTVIAVGGTATTAACMLLKKDFNKREVHGFIIEDKDIIRLTEKLKTMTVSEIQKLAGMEREKADIILCGLYILKISMNHFNTKNICVKTTGVLYGCLSGESRIKY